MRDSHAVASDDVTAKIRLLTEYFLARKDTFAFAPPRGNPRPGFLHPEDMDKLEDLLRAHVAGASAPSVRIYFERGDGTHDAKEMRARIGSYALALDGTVVWSCLDFDGGVGHAHALADPQGAALYAVKKAEELGIPAYLEVSRSGAGYHLWLFFPRGTPAWLARGLGLLLAPARAPLANGGEADPKRSVGIEVFPKAPRVAEGGVGTMVFLPWYWDAPDGANQFVRVAADGSLEVYLPETFERISSDAAERLLADAGVSEAGVFAKVPQVGTTAPREGVRHGDAPASFLQSAVDRYNTEHPRSYPSSGGQCPACGHKGCFGQLANNPRRWSCFSASHGECGVGREGSTCWFGDALDLDAAAAGVDRMELLREGGYLDDEEDESEDGATWAADCSAAAHAQGSSVALGSSPTVGPGQASNNTGLVSSGSVSSARTRSGTGRPKVYKAKTYATCCDIIRNNAANILDGELEYNEMLLTPTIDRKVPPTSIVGILRERIELRLTPPKKKGKKPPKKLTFSEAQVTSALLQVAEERSYHPVRDYLNGLVWDGVERIKDVAPVLLGIANPDLLTQAILKRFFISAVARPLEPGCKVDTVLVLVGAQGARKSSFFKALAGPEWFSDSAVDLKNKDSLMLMRRIWFHEWAELETMRKSEATQVKAHLFSAVDMLRPAYGRRIEEFPRTSIIVASTNIPAFLNDETGSRRFWIVSGCTCIDVEKARQWRDQLWAEAVALYHAKEQWWLTPDEDALRAARNVDHEQQDIWGDVVLDAVVRRLTVDPEAPITTQSLLEDHLGKQPKDWTQADQKRVAGILQRLGFTDDRKRVKGQRLSLWTPPPAILVIAAERRDQDAKAMREEEEALRRQQEALKAKKNVDDSDFS